MTAAPPILPMDVLPHVLQHLDLQQRLGSCARVCHTWHTAACTATKDIQLDTLNQSRATGMSDWISAHGSHLAKLRVHGRLHSVRLNLPCLQLKQLELLHMSSLEISTSQQPHTSSRSGGTVPTADPAGNTNSSSSGGGQQMYLAPLTRLSSLQLTECDVQLQHLHSMSTLTSLRQLRLDCITCSAVEEQDDCVEVLDAAIGGAISHLVQLTQLCFNEDDNTTDAALAHVSCLQQLRELKVFHGTSTPTSFPPLPGSLTLLELEGVGIQLPAVLAGCVQLRHLALDYCSFPGSDGSRALLVPVGSMTQMQHLDLNNSVPVVAPAAYTALTVSSQLTCLCCGDALHGMALPVGAGSHIFAAGRQLPGLRVLELGFDMGEAAAAPKQQAVCQEDMDSLLGACSGLRELYLFYHILPNSGGPNALPLQLHGLVALKTCLAQLNLNCGGSGMVRVGDELAQHVLAQLTGLQKLTAYGPHGLTYMGLLHLTQLRQLKELCIDLFGAGAPVGTVLLCNKAPAGCPPDVWQQLQELCISSSKECAQLVLQQRRDELAVLRVQPEAARSEAAVQAEAQVSRLQQQLAKCTMHSNAKPAAPAAPQKLRDVK